ncbi:LysR family transcriptional regulator [Pediococcus siamensis]|uniref:LysR family transcriptional regulator n=1 Tax=Pediococcus siamensis TaxID=381829 RepID=UPI0039A2529F
MELRVLKYFIAVVNEENITKAAQSLHISQPALSRQLKELEEELNVKLFIRGKRQITLTPSGTFLFKRAREMLTLADKTVNNLMNTDNLMGDLYVGAGETPIMRVVAKLAKKLLVMSPDIHLHFYSANADDIIERLNTGILDFGLVIDPVNKKNFDFIRLPGQTLWGVLLRKDDPLAAKAWIEPTDLKGKPLIISQQSFVNSQIASWFGQTIENSQIVATYNLLYNASLLVEEKIGYAICFEGIINTSGNSNLKFVPLKSEEPLFMNLIWKKNASLSRVAQAFINQVHQLNQPN